jgi:hypothetical protein
VLLDVEVDALFVQKIQKSSIRCKPSFVMLISYLFLKRGSLKSLWHYAALPAIVVTIARPTHELCDH